MGVHEREQRQDLSSLNSHQFTHSPLSIRDRKCHRQRCPFDRENRYTLLLRDFLRISSTLLSRRVMTVTRCPSLTSAPAKWKTVEPFHPIVGGILTTALQCAQLALNGACKAPSFQ